MMFSTPMNSRLATPTRSSMNVAKIWRRKYRYSSWAWSSFCRKKGSQPTSFSAETNLR